MSRTVGVEEELFLLDPETRSIASVAPRSLEAHLRTERTEPVAEEVEAELYQEQIELNSAPCTSGEDLRRSLVAARKAVVAAARAAGARAVAVPTPVLAYGEPSITPKPRYRRIQQEYGATAREALVCAMHVHVEVTDEDEAVRAVDRVQPWLPVLLALSAGSPFAGGLDTGYASWRSQVWSRWPTGGAHQAFGSAAEYHRVTGLLQEWGAALDPGMLYLDVRPARSLPTVEIRVADVCADVDDAVLVALLVRALVETVLHAPPPPLWRADLLRAAHWRAARHGVGDRLVDPDSLRLRPASDVVDSLITGVAPALGESGDETWVRAHTARLLATGGGAGRQRAVLERSGSLEAVLDDLVDRTERS